MRGAHRRPDPADHGEGIIPAYAGSTSTVLDPETADRDHPRVCGEHGLFFQPPARSQGSSPRMRGAHIIVRIVPSDTGIIPAYAGSTSFMLDDSDFVKDHPRVCGEHQSAYEDEK